MRTIHYTAGMDCNGRIAMVPVSQNVAIAPVVEQTIQPTYQPAPEQPKPKPIRGIPIPLILIGGLLCFLVLNPGKPSGTTLSELQIQNEHLRQRIDQLEYQLIGVYSAQ